MSNFNHFYVKNYSSAIYAFYSFSIRFTYTTLYLSKYLSALNSTYKNRNAIFSR